RSESTHIFCGGIGISIRLVFPLSLGLSRHAISARTVLRMKMCLIFAGCWGLAIEKNDQGNLVGKQCWVN
ncbi:unnamed protein product, partial [Amoebophrya sp. A25]